MRRNDWHLVYAIACFIICALIVVALFGGQGDGESSRATVTRAPTSPAATYTHHRCIEIKPRGRTVFTGTNLLTGAFERDLDPNRCTDITWDDGKRIFSIPRSDVEKLIRY